MKLNEMTMIELANSLSARKITALETVNACLEAIKEFSTYNAFNYIDAEGAREIAESIDRQRAAGAALPRFAGVPIAVKDSFCVQGMPCTCSSKMLQGFYPPYGSEVSDRLRRAGFIIIGKTNMDEFGMGSDGRTSYGGAVLNPIDNTLTAGGSSGGSACAVKLNIAFAGIGSDAGGSIRLPAAYCGVVGVKPTHGLIPINGYISVSPSFDSPGVFCKDVSDATALIDILSESDGTSDYKPSGIGALQLKDMRIAALSEAAAVRLIGDEKLFGSYINALEAVRKQGAAITEVEFPYFSHATAVYRILGYAEAASSMTKMDGIRYGFRAPDCKDVSELITNSRTQGLGLEVKKRIIAGNLAVKSENYERYYKKARQARAYITSKLSDIFKGADCLLLPAIPAGAPACTAAAELDRDIFLYPANLAGLPATVLPAANIQILSAKYGEKTMLSAAAAIEALYV